ncbi:MAG TPA: hypothetical protein VMT58_05415, partial [Candidatus Binataceae bacterium]|nr:hypothetical protein [Candidatus Binataceae bacterium]
MASPRRKTPIVSAASAATPISGGGRVDVLKPILAEIGGGDWVAGAGLIAALTATAIVFCRSLENQFVFDDREMIVLNRYLGNWSFLLKSLVNDSWWFRDPAHLPQGSYYRPIQDIWLWMNFHLFALNPTGWHLASLAVHLIVVWLVFRVASILAGDTKTGAAAALLFGLMPIHAEAVVWATAAPIPLAAAFELGALDSYLRGGRRAVSLALFAGALLSHESAVAFPLLIVAYALLFGPAQTQDGSYSASLRTALAVAFPYLLETVAYLALRWWILGLTVGPVRSNRLSVLEAIWTFPSAIAAYGEIMTIPWFAGPAHGLEIVRSAGGPGFFVPAIAIAGLCAAIVFLLNASPRSRLYLFCAVWILIAIAPALN